MKQSANYTVTDYVYNKEIQGFTLLEINNENVPLEVNVPKVAAPTVTKTTAISIASTTTSATIFYKEDSGAYQEYTIPFTPTEGTSKIYTFAVKDGMLPSSVTEYTVE